MDISFKCGSCGKGIKVAGRFAGKSAACPACKARVTIPDVPAQPEARAVRKPSRIMAALRKPMVWRPLLAGLILVPLLVFGWVQYGRYNKARSVYWLIPQNVTAIMRIDIDAVRGNSGVSAYRKITSHFKQKIRESEDDGEAIASIFLFHAEGLVDEVCYINIPPTTNIALLLRLRPDSAEQVEGILRRFAKTTRKREIRGVTVYSSADKFSTLQIARVLPTTIVYADDEFALDEILSCFHGNNPNAFNPGGILHALKPQSGYVYYGAREKPQWDGSAGKYTSPIRTVMLGAGEQPRLSIGTCFVDAKGDVQKLPADITEKFRKSGESFCKDFGVDLMGLEVSESGNRFFIKTTLNQTVFLQNANELIGRLLSQGVSEVPGFSQRRKIFQSWGDMSDDD